MSQFSYIVNANPAAFIQQPHQHHIQQQQQIHLAPAHHHRGAQHGHEHKPLVRGKTSPYGFFVKMCYEEHKKKYPNEQVQVTEISKKCSQKWKTMSDDEKRRFFELAQKDAERYQAEVAAYGGDEVMRKRKRAKKDPNAPKRALSAFFFFSNEKRQEVQQSHPEWKVGQIAQELGRNWKSITESDREIYDKKAHNDKERYAEEMRLYRIATGKPPINPPQPQQQQPQAQVQQQLQPDQQPPPQQHQQQEAPAPQMVVLQQPGQLPMQILEEQTPI